MPVRIVALLLALLAPAAGGAPSLGDEALSPAVQSALAQLAPQRPGVIDLYAVVVAGDGEEDVFRREVEAVQRVLDERLGTRGRSLALVNHRSLPRPEATLKSIELTLNALAKQMDVAEDILFLHLTSHGAANHVLVLKHPATELYGLSPKYLRELLDRSGIRHRVLVISGCYTGGCIPPLATVDTMILTAANAARPSYGCGNDSEITEYSRALYLKALARTRSLREAAGIAVQLIHEDERASKIAYSYPQIRSGFAIEERLRRFEQQPSAN
jgi:Peptidase C13 family